MPRRALDALPASRTVSTNVRTIRLQHGWSQRDLAHRTNSTTHPVGLNTIGRMDRSLEPGTAPVAVSVDVLTALAAALGVTTDRLLTAAACHACQDTPPPGYTCDTCSPRPGSRL